MNTSEHVSETGRNESTDRDATREFLLIGAFNGVLFGVLFLVRSLIKPVPGLGLFSRTPFAGIILYPLVGLICGFIASRFKSRTRSHWSAAAVGLLCGVVCSPLFAVATRTGEQSLKSALMICLAAGVFTGATLGATFYHHYRLR